MRSHVRVACTIGLLVAGCAAPQTAPSPTPGTSTAPSTLPSGETGATGAASAAPGASPTPVASPTPATFKVSGQVLSDERLPVSGATVTAFAPDATASAAAIASATVQADGSYALQLPAGSYNLTASNAGWTRRTQPVSVSGPTTVGFGTDVTGGLEPHFLSDNPEVESVQAKEDAPGGPLSLIFTMSEPLTATSQQNFTYRFGLDSGTSTAFLKATGISEDYLQTQTSWDSAGKVFTVKYNYAYLPSGPDGDVFYTARLKQNQLDTQDPVTREFQWEDMGIVDASGKPLGKGRAGYAFVQDQLNVLDLSLLTDFKYGYNSDARRWNLTHKGEFRFTAAKDTVPPQLLSVDVKVNAPIGNINQDLLEMHFSKPMRCVKDAANLEFTRLINDKDKQYVILNASKQDNGSNPVAITTGQPSEIEFFRTDPNLVVFHYPSNTFKDMQWVEVTLGNDVRDPADNKPDPQHSRVSGAVLGGS